MEAFIKAISYYLPEKVLTNSDLVQLFPEWTVEKVTKKIGINTRHIAAQGETAGDMAINAAKNLFKDYNIDKSTIDFVLLCTQSPDYILPTTACLIQHKLGLSENCGALDFNMGCSGYVYGLSLAKGLICSGTAKNVLLLTSETYSKYIHPQDKGNRSIFGDAATASLISTQGFAQIQNFCLGSNGEKGDYLIIKNGASRNPDKSPEDQIVTDDKGFVSSPNNLYMKGSGIFNFTLEYVPPLVAQTIKVNNISSEDVDLYVFHQANKFMLETIRRISGIEQEKFYINMEDVGNTVSSTIPIALKDIITSNKISANKTVLIAGFGVGLSWGACTLRFC